VNVGFHSPLPPARSGVADYSIVLLEALRQFGDVAANSSQPRNVELYHLGNNQLHRAIYRRALKQPGVVVLHDAVLQHFFLGAMREEQYIEEFVYNYGEWNRPLAKELWDGRARSAQDARYFRFSMLRRIAEVAPAVVVHNPAAKERVLDHVPTANVVEIPHLCAPAPQPPGYTVERLRLSLGASASATVFGVFGYLRESKRLFSVLRAFRRVRAEQPNAQLILAGECASSDLERGLAPFLDDPGVHRIGFLEEDQFHLYTAATDVCLNLRYPEASETSGIAIRMMGAGKAVVLSAGRSSDFFPEGSCVRVDSGPAETEMLAEYMLWLARDLVARRTIGSRAAEFIVRNHAVEQCAEQYWNLLQTIPQRRAVKRRSVRAY